MVWVLGWLVWFGFGWGFVRLFCCVCSVLVVACCCGLVSLLISLSTTVVTYYPTAISPGMESISVELCVQPPLSSLNIMHLTPEAHFFSSRFFKNKYQADSHSDANMKPIKVD